MPSALRLVDRRSGPDERPDGVECALPGGQQQRRHASFGERPARAVGGNRFVAFDLRRLDLERRHVEIGAGTGQPFHHVGVILDRGEHQRGLAEGPLLRVDLRASRQQRLRRCPDCRSVRPP